MKRKMFEVWKEVPAFSPKTPWKVQLPHGILSFHTKKMAVAYANAMATAFLEK